MADDGHFDRDLYKELYEIICEAVCIRHTSVRIAGEDYPQEMVRKRFLELNSSHLQYVIDCMKKKHRKSRKHQGISGHRPV